MLRARTGSFFASALLVLIASVLASTATLVRADEAAPTPEQQEFIKKLQALNWVRGPKTVDVMGNSKLDVPEGYLFLDRSDTKKYLEMNENLSDGSEVMIAPHDLHWSAYLSFADEGYVKDTDKIDGSALLKSLQDATESANSERRKRGWAEMHVVGWAVPPAYNSDTKRLEWATDLQSGSNRDVNFFTKILGRRGHTSVVLVSTSQDLKTAEPDLNRVLAGYRFSAGDTYGDYKPGDKVAEYGLAALVLGGAAAIATKKGFWAVLGGFFAAAWKFIAAGVVAIGAWLRKQFGNKTA